MKKLFAVLLTVTLIISLFACENEDDGIAGSAETDDAPDSTAETLDFSDTESILKLYRSAEGYAGVTYSADSDIYSMSTDFSIHSTDRSYSRDADGNISVLQTGDKASSFSLIDGIYYKNGEAVFDLPENELASLAEELRLSNYDFDYDVTTYFGEIVAVSNENGTYTIACHSEDEAVINIFMDGIRFDLDGVFSDGADFDVSSVDYQLMINDSGAPLAFVVAASFELITDEPTAEGSLENFYSYLYVAAVSECTDDIPFEE